MRSGDRNQQLNAYPYPRTPGFAVPLQVQLRWLYQQLASPAFTLNAATGQPFFRLLTAAEIRALTPVP